MNKSRLCFFFLLSLFSFSVYAKETNGATQINSVTNNNNEYPKKITISGKFTFLNPMDKERFNWVYIRAFSDSAHGYITIDSSHVNPDHTYSISLVVDHPQLYRIFLISWNSVAFWGDHDLVINDRGYDTAAIKIKDPPYVYLENASPCNQLINVIQLMNYWNYQRTIRNYAMDYFAYQDYLVNGDSTWRDYLKDTKQIPSGEFEYQKELYTIVKNYATVPSVLLALFSLDGNEDFKKEIIKNILKTNHNFGEAKNYLSYLEHGDELVPGNKIPPFHLPDTTGHYYTEENFKGKYLLLDFWASWCGPCRQAIDKIRQFYKGYKNDQDFQIVSISIDDNKKDWIDAIRHDRPTWLQLVATNVPIYRQRFNANGVPHFFLVNKDGIIIKQYYGFSSAMLDTIKQILTNPNIK
ncbi:MAG: TlpA disulfide reductase family protein [Phycisphaerales bacterium]|nr:TlpA disulfide reductase family protein [Phycisphaerales bacterium]